MNGIENIIKRISDEASCEKEQILSNARKNAAEILDGYKSKCAEMKKEADEKSTKRAEEEYSRIVGGYQLEEKKATLAKKQELISKAFEEAYRKLTSLSEDEKVDVLARLALKAAEGKKGEIILSSSDREKLSDKLMQRLSENGGLRISDETRDIGGGLVFKNGQTEVNCTFRSLVDEMREKMSRETADILFG